MATIRDPGFVLELTKQAISDANNESVKLSTLLRSAIRIARLTNDPVFTWRLEMEMIDHDDAEANKALQHEAYNSIPNERFDAVRRSIVEDFIDERSSRADLNDLKSEPSVWGQSVSQTEIHIEQLKQDIVSNKLLRQTRWDQGYPITSADYDQSGELHLLRLRAISERIRQRVYSYLTRLEQKLQYVEINSGVFERYKEYVDSRLSDIAPRILDQFNHAYERTSAGDLEAYSQAAMMCRRILKSVADIVYPGRNHEVIGQDGKPHKVTDQEYVNRLIQYLSENLDSASNKKVIIASLKSLGFRLVAINSLASKGDHDSINSTEIDLCVIQTYLGVGDVLRVYDEANEIL